MDIGTPEQPFFSSRTLTVWSSPLATGVTDKWVG